MNANLMMRAAELLAEARDLFDRSDAPPEYAAKLQEVIDLIESRSGAGENFSRPAAYTSDSAFSAHRRGKQK